MPAKLKLALAQLNPKVGDLPANLGKITTYARKAAAETADLIIFPELAITGYPPEDLLLRAHFIAACEHTLAELTARTAEWPNLAVVIGHPLRENGHLYNALSLIQNGKTRIVYRKQHLPNFAVFDEKRYFTAGRDDAIVGHAGLNIGLTICQDIWEEGPAARLAKAGADLIITINASPFHDGQAKLRERVLANNACKNAMPIVYLNQVGGQDELVFDGASLAVDAFGEAAARLPAFEEAMQTVVFQAGKPGRFITPPPPPALAREESVYRALVLGVRDYVGKNNFPGVVLGLSGGIDSALTLAIAVDAIGAQRVLAMMLPSRFTSDMSLQDARELAGNLRVQYEVIDIEAMYESAIAALQPLFAGDEFAAADGDTTWQNLQARIRGQLLMAISNRRGFLLLSTGNKSESAVGYATLYGDMAGGFCPLQDAAKMMVYKLAEWRNARDASAVIPARIITRAPSAELAEGQRDEDNLPAYSVLDSILECFVERGESAEEMIARGFDAEVVRRVIRMVDVSQHKRRQSAPGPRVTGVGFGKDWRMPLLTPP